MSEINQDFTEQTVPEIPKSRETFSGDINDAVIKVQQITGFEITPQWWGEHVGNHGATEEIIDRFDAAFESFVHDQVGIEAADSSTEEGEAEFVGEVARELERFDLEYGDEPSSAPLREEFLEALGEHLQQKYFNKDLEDAAERVLLSGSAEYNSAEQLKRTEEDPVTGILELHYESAFGNEVTVLGTTHVYETSSPEIAYIDDLIHSIPEDSHAVLILEGQYGESGATPEDPSEAIKVSGGEFGYMAAVAKQRGIEVIPAEPDPHDTAEQILATNSVLSRADIALHYGVKALKGIFNGTNTASLEAVAPYIHHSVGIGGSKDQGGWVENVTSRQEVVDLKDAQKQEILAEMPTIIEQLNRQFKKIKLGQRLLSLDESGILHLEYDLDKPPILWDPAPEQLGESVTALTEISRQDMLIRDRHTLRLMHEALVRGREPIIAVGSSHISALRPALDNYFATRPD